MAKGNSKPKSKAGNYTPPSTDLTLWWTTLNYFPPELKNNLWAAEATFYMKKNSVEFLDQQRASTYRAQDNLVINSQAYINMIDPPTPQGSGGTASYFSADFKANPIDVHLDNIVEADILERIPQQLTVNVNDPIAKSQKQKDADKIIYQRELREIINRVWKQLGIQPLKETQDPYQYVKGLQSQQNSEDSGDNADSGNDSGGSSNNSADAGKGGGFVPNSKQAVNALPDVIQYVRNEIQDSEDLMLYNQYVYKCDIEKAFELGLQHYMVNQNKWNNYLGRGFFNDLKNFNKACGRKYCDITTGRPTIRYVDPVSLFTSPFKQRNGEDVTFFFYEEDYSFGDFVRMFGAGLTQDQLKTVFNLNKQQVAGSAGHGLEYDDVTGTPYGNNALIRIGFASMLTQDTQVFADGYVNDQTPAFSPKDIDWYPKNDEEDVEKLARTEKTYNVWYSWYYIPPPSSNNYSARNSQADWRWQSQYIFNLDKEVDQERYGEDLRYAKPTLVLWRDIRPSFTDVKQAFMPKIHNLWHKFQNCLIADTNGIAIADDFLGGLLAAVDESNKNGEGTGRDAAMEQWKMLRQSGMAFVRFRDKNGNLIADPGKYFVPIDTKHLDKAERYLQLILGLYQQMTMALAFSDVTEGQEGQPRVAVAAITAAIQSSSKGRWWLEHAYEQFVVMFAERFVYDFWCWAYEKDEYDFPDRWEEFQDIVGLANAMELEGVAKINMENIGITVSNDMLSDQKKQVIMSLAQNFVQTKELNPEILGMLLNEQMPAKYMYALLAVGLKKTQREMAAQQELQYQQQMQLQQMQLQTALALKGAESQGVNSNIQTQGQVDAQVQGQMNQLKEQTMAKQKQQLLQNKLVENSQKANFKRQENNQKIFADQAT